MILAALRRNHSKYHDELSIALDLLVETIENMCVKHGTTLGTQTVTSWKEQISRSEADFVSFVNRVEEKLEDQTSGPPAPIVAIPAPDTQVLPELKWLKLT